MKAKEKLKHYKKFVNNQEGFTNGFNNRAIEGKLLQVKKLREGLILGYFEDGTTLNLDTIKLEGKYIIDLEVPEKLPEK